MDATSALPWVRCQGEHLCVSAERRKTWSGGQIADIKAQYEAEQAGSPGQFDRVARQANVLL